MIPNNHGNNLEIKHRSDSVFGFFKKNNFNYLSILEVFAAFLLHQVSAESKVANAFTVRKPVMGYIFQGDS